MNRRHFLLTSGAVLASRLAGAQSGSTTRQESVRTPALDIGYVESGPADGSPVILLHGFPDDVHAYDEVAPPLAAKGFRVLVPYLRGYGRTHFRDENAP